jgi:hypothetical protein
MCRSFPGLFRVYICDLELIRSRSDPESPGFSKHWTSDEVIEMFAPAEETVGAVRKWLVDHGIPNDRITHSDNQGVSLTGFLSLKGGPSTPQCVLSAMENILTLLRSG